MRLVFDRLVNLMGTHRSVINIASTDWCTIHICKCRVSAYESAYRRYGDDISNGRNGGKSE